MNKCDVCLRSEGGVCPSCAPAEIARLRAALETAQKERDYKFTQTITPTEIIEEVIVTTDEKPHAAHVEEWMQEIVDAYPVVDPRIVVSTATTTKENDNE